MNLGGWLLMEGYILRGRNIPESEFKQKFKTAYGQKKLFEFERCFRDNFIQEKDFKIIAGMGANAIRVPFHYRLIETKPFRYSVEGIAYFKKVFLWAKKYKLRVILDLHAACGAQNHDWHSDSDGRAYLWENKEFQERTYALWEKIADIFKDETSLCGYDVLNEPILDGRDPVLLTKFYRQLIKRIRAVDKKNIIFLEGDIWAQRIDYLNELISDDTSISIHAYEPFLYTLNLNPLQTFPGTINGVVWNEKKLYKYMEKYYQFSLRNKVKIYVGEFGVNWRGGFWGELKWVKTMLDVFKAFNFGYTYWTYKAVANTVFPDGLYQYIPNNSYVNREGPVYGWERYVTLWKTDKDKIVDFWSTDNYTPNKNLILLLKKYFTAI